MDLSEIIIRGVILFAGLLIAFKGYSIYKRFPLLIIFLGGGIAGYFLSAPLFSNLIENPADRLIMNLLTAGVAGFFFWFLSKFIKFLFHLFLFLTGSLLYFYILAKLSDFALFDYLSLIHYIEFLLGINKLHLIYSLLTGLVLSISGIYLRVFTISLIFITVGVSLMYFSLKVYNPYIWIGTILLIVLWNSVVKPLIRKRRTPQMPVDKIERLIPPLKKGKIAEESSSKVISEQNEKELMEQPRAEEQEIREQDYSFENEQKVHGENTTASSGFDEDTSSSSDEKE